MTHLSSHPSIVHPLWNSQTQACLISDLFDYVDDKATAKGCFCCWHLADLFLTWQRKQVMC